jgi:hypothetical protein
MEQNPFWLGQNFPFNVKVNETAYFCKWLYNFAPLLSQTLVVVIHYLYSRFSQTQHSMGWGGGEFSTLDMGFWLYLLILS